MVTNFQLSKEQKLSMVREKMAVSDFENIVLDTKIIMRFSSKVVTCDQNAFLLVADMHCSSPENGLRTDC